MRPQNCGKVCPDNGFKRRTVTRDHSRNTASFGLKISKAGGIYIAITILLGFSAVNTGNNLLFLVVSALLSFMATTGYTGMVNIKGIIPEIIPPDELYAGAPARFRVLLHNRKQLFPSFLIRISSTDCGTYTLVPFIKRGELLETGLELTFPTRGRNRIGQIRISSPFPVNFFTRYWNYQIDSTCIVYPRLIPANLPDSASDTEQTGIHSREKNGQDGELQGIREYSGAENIRSIHWKLSARSTELMVKEFGSQAAPPLIIRLEELPGADEEERLSRAAWLVRQRALEQPVGLIMGGQSVLPATGQMHCMNLLTELALYGHNQTL